MSKPRKPRKSRAKPPEQHKPDGRPTQYRAQYATIAFGFAVAGYTDKEMAGFFGVSERTLNTWKLKHPKFLQSIQTGKEPANAKAASVLFKLATEGWQHKAVKIMQHEGASFEHEYIERFPPDAGLLRFFLKNRMPDKWRDKHEQVLTDPNGAGAFDVLAVEIAKQLAKNSEK